MAGWEGGVVSVSQSPHAPISPRHRSSRVRQSKRRRGRKKHSPLARSLSFVVHFVVHSFVPFQSFITGFGSQLHSKSLSQSFVICHLSFVICHLSSTECPSSLRVRYSHFGILQFPQSQAHTAHARQNTNSLSRYCTDRTLISSIQFISSSVRRP